MPHDLFKYFIIYFTLAITKLPICGITTELSLGVLMDTIGKDVLDDLSLD
jgi:hypothetical protein